MGAYGVYVVILLVGLIQTIFITPRPWRMWLIFLKHMTMWMLFMGWRNTIYGKTGYTRSAQACFIGTVQKGETTLVVGVFGCTDRWNDIKDIVAQYGGLQL